MSAKAEGSGGEALFSHRPLSDPTRMIRLLSPGTRVRPENPEEENVKSPTPWELFYTRLDDAPPFLAISYTWGSAWSSDLVFVERKRAYIPFNCYNALEQALFYYPHHYFWVDSISIDQSNVLEKNVQVQMMGRIFSKAISVLAWVGHHADNSHNLLSWAPTMEEVVDMQAQHRLEHPVGPGREWQHRISMLDFDDASKLCQAWYAFCGRAYWQRTWILQELALGQEIFVLCGDSKLGWRQLNVLRRTIDESNSRWDKFKDSNEFPYARKAWEDSKTVPWLTGPTTSRMFGFDPGQIGNLNRLSDINRLIEAGPSSQTLESVLREFGTTQCRDPKDRIYAFGSLIDWAQLDIHPLEPNYELTAFGLAIQVADFLPGNAIEFLLKALDVDHTNEELKDRILAKQRIGVALSGGTSNDRWLSLSKGQCEVFTILRNKSGDLTVLFCKDPFGHGRRPEQVPAVSAWMDRFRIGADVCELVVDSEPALLANKASREGDLLAPTDTFIETSRVYIVLRPMGSDYYDIVGQAIALDSYVPIRRPGAPRAKIMLRLTPEDIVTLVGQDLSLTWGYYMKARCARLFTSVTTNQSAAAFVMWEPEQERRRRIL